MSNWIRLAPVLVAGVLGVVLAAGPARAAPEASLETPHVSVRLASEVADPTPGRPFELAVEIRPKAGWHVYWSNPGEAGLAPEATWSGPDGLSVGPLRHPAPVRMVLQGVASFVHEGPATLLATARLSAPAQRGAALPVRSELRWLVCSESECVPEQANLSLPLTVGDGRADPANAALFAAARRAQPQALPAPGRFAPAGDGLSLFLPLRLDPDVDAVEVFPASANDFVAQGPASPRRVEGGMVAPLAQAGAMAPKAMSGLVRIKTKDGFRSWSFVANAGTVPAGAQPPGPAFSPVGFALALSGAVLGGLLLNLMPCVFPILSLKALALVRSGEGEREARLEAIGYAAGAVATLTALGAALLVLRAGGAAAGWAFQLQNPQVVSILMLLCLAIALNLAGLFELPGLSVAGSSRGGLLGGAATGALAAFVATPCTGPFMAGALGAALVAPPAAALAVFAGLGLGLAAPFLAIGFVPRVRRMMPRPGPWMNALRRLLSVPMFATVLGLAWVLGRQAGVSAMTVALAAALLLGLCLWWRGAIQASGAGRMAWLSWLPMAGAAALVLAPMPVEATRAAESKAGLAAEPYSASRLAALRADGRPVFVYLTADWCLSCKVNEATSLSSPEVASAFGQAGIAVLEGDWTRSDPEVSRLLAEHGRAGVPLYIFFGADGTVRELPQILTPGALTALARA